MAAADVADPLATRLLYSPQDPEPPQQAFLLLDELGVLEAFYGGAGGGGKSSALLMAALKYVDVPGYAAILFRKSFADLNLPGALIPRSKEWLANSDARWLERDFRWTFPSGATLSFAYLQHTNDRYRYAGAEFQYIAFDELTAFDELDYTFLFTRLRRPSGLGDDNPLAKVPLRMRSASNPGQRGHEWVKRRLIERLPRPVPDGEVPDPMDTPERARARVFIPAKLEDNPHVDREAYEESLANLDPVLRAQILEGDWDIRQPGEWVFDHDGIAAALELGRRYDALLDAGTMPPPAGELLATGLDWGEHSGIVLGWPLERGGMYVPMAVQVVGAEPGETTDEALELLDELYRLGRRQAPAARGRRRAPAALPEVPDPLVLVEEHRYDAAGVQSMRTYLKSVRRRHPRARSLSVSFGAPAPQSGGRKAVGSYKGEAIGYIRRLLERAAAEVNHGGDVEAYVNAKLNPTGRPLDEKLERRILAHTRRLERAGVLAIGHRAHRPGPPHNAELVRQMRKVEWADRDRGTVKKGDDHVADALIALEAPQAVRHR